MLKLQTRTENMNITDKLLMLREIAGDDHKQIIQYHMLVARYLRMKAKHGNVLNAYVDMKGIHS